MSKSSIPILFICKFFFLLFCYISLHSKTKYFTFSKQLKDRYEYSEM